MACWGTSRSAATLLLADLDDRDYFERHHDVLALDQFEAFLTGPVEPKLPSWAPISDAEAEIVAYVFSAK